MHEIHVRILPSDIDTQTDMSWLERIYVHEKIFEEFKAAIVKVTLQLKVGDGTEPGVFLGPIQNAMQYERVKGFFEHVKDENFDIAVGGDIPTGKGYFVNPTIIDRPPETSRLVVEEPFGKSDRPTRMH